MAHCGQFLSSTWGIVQEVSETTTAGRLLRLLAMLQARREWPGAVLAERLQVSPRTVRRDVERLRELGYPIRSSTGPAGGYVLEAGTAMPPLLLDDEEATAVAIALRTAARSAVQGIDETALRALVKLEQVLPARLRRRIQALGEVSELARVGDSPSVDAGLLTLLAGACREHERVRFSYRGRDGAASRRTVEPHALVAAGRRWYLVAFDPSRNAWRTFRVDRISSPAPAASRFRRRTVPGRDAARFVQRSLAGVVYRHEASVRFLASAEELRGRLPRGWGKPRQLPDGSCRCEISDRRPRLAGPAHRNGPRGLRAGRPAGAAGAPDRAGSAAAAGGRAARRRVAAAAQSSGVV